MTPHEQSFDTFLQVRLTTHDKERIKARALEAGMQTSEYVRKRALGEPPWPKNRYLPAFQKLAREEAQTSVALDGETMREDYPIAPHIHEARDTL